MAADDKCKVPLFDGTNYSNWKFRMEVLLDEMDLLNIIQEPMDDSKLDKGNPQELQAVKKKEKKCKSQIIQRIADTHLEYIKDKATAYEIWEELKNTFERKGMAGQLLVRKELLTMKFNPAKERIEEHFRNFDRLARELRSTGATLQEGDLVCHLLLTMPNDYDSVVTALETLSAENLTLNFVKNRLRDEEMKRQSKTRKCKLEVQPSTAFTTPGGKETQMVKDKRNY